MRNYSYIPFILVFLCFSAILYKNYNKGNSNSSADALAISKNDLKQLMYLVVKEMSQKSENQISPKEVRGDQVQMKQDPPQDSGSSLKKYRRGITEYSQAFYDRLHKLTSRKAGSRDSELIQLVRDIIDPPSYEGMHKPSRYLAATPQAAEVEAILNQKRNGFFFECGALDGERSSNSFWLEDKYNWTGILVEMDPHYYAQILGKNRRSWSINACLSPYDYVTELPFYGDAGGQGRVSMETGSKAKSVPCFPFETIMLAVNKNHIDYFSLDVEGVEFPILKTIPFDRVTVDMMSVEYGHDPVGKNETAKFMIGKGFRLHKDIHHVNTGLHLYVEDFIFVRKDLKVEPK